ncbi:MAG: ATP-dependent DNA helicase RecQ, partial [Boseongicola sp. SB0677_bin_26]|nr:ATP-dependent DNA helicase RecQ [Boseongicola sp. SB0665_bin_10]MYG25008.1 ATP-dependent DNA helicase RecQ [Boseongicola sp. SB0677_bin_26]
GADIAKALWRSYLRQLAATDVLRIDIGGYGALQLGARARAVLKGVENVALHGEAATPSRKRRQAAEFPAGNTDPALLARLKQARLEIAREEGVPAFVVFHDRSLQDMAARKPQSLEQLADCHGVGASKLARYGERILATLKDAGCPSQSTDAAVGEMRQG